MTAQQQAVQTDPRVDVLVIGGGNAALCAAIEARRQGATVLVVEAAPKVYRGGNTRHTRNLRCAHDEGNEILTGPYPEDEFWDDLMRVTGGETDPELARLTIAESKTLWDWMNGVGVRFQQPLGGTLNLGRTNAFFLGGGRAMLNALCDTAEKMGVEIRYDTTATALDIEDGFFKSATIDGPDGQQVIHARALVTAAGGFEANIEWLKEYWGERAENFLIRGTPNNRGTILRMLLDAGVEPVGDPTQCHAVAIDARSPQFDGGIVTRLDCIIFGVVLNNRCERFYDEGEDFWPKRYAIWGRLVADQPDQIAWIVFDEKAAGRFMPSVYPAISAPSLEELAEKLGLDPSAFAAEIGRFNAAVVDGEFNTEIHDDCRTEGITPPKSHWARRIDQAPFHAYPVRPGITFTYLGTRVNREARVLMQGGRPSANIYAAGEIMAGNVLGRGYLAGIGMTIGAVFGRLAGEGAARHVGN